MYGFHGLNHQIIEKVEMSRLWRRTESWKPSSFLENQKPKKKMLFIMTIIRHFRSSGASCWDSFMITTTNLPFGRSLVRAAADIRSNFFPKRVPILLKTTGDRHSLITWFHILSILFLVQSYYRWWVEMPFKKAISFVYQNWVYWNVNIKQGCGGWTWDNSKRQPLSIINPLKRKLLFQWKQ